MFISPRFKKKQQQTTVGQKSMGIPTLIRQLRFKTGTSFLEGARGALAPCDSFIGESGCLQSSSPGLGAAYHLSHVTHTQHQHLHW